MKTIFKIITAAFILFTAFASAFSQTENIQENQVNSDSKKNSEIQKNEEKKNTEIQKKVYPVFRHPPGFYKGVLLLGALSGRTIAPNGSFIRHEKSYDKMMKQQIESEVYNNGISQFPGTYFEARYIPKETAQMDVEYGLSEHFGFGFSMFHYSIESRRQDVIHGSARTGQIYYEPLPMKRNLFSGTAVNLLGTFHATPRRILDPYISLRAGGLAYSGNAHRTLNYDSDRQSSEITNGIGKFFGSGMGVNFFLTPAAGIKFETNFNKSFLGSDQFSNRTLDTYNIQIGFFMNYSAVASNNYK